MADTSTRRLSAYAPLVMTLAVWSFVVVGIIFEVLQWPYVGAVFKTDDDAQTVYISDVRSGAPAELAGLAVGDEIVALEYGNGQRYRMTGLEAIKSRGQIRSYDILNRTTEAKKTVWRILNSGPVTFETSTGKRVTLLPDATRDIATLPVSVFTLGIQALIIFMIGGGIFAFAPMSRAVCLLIASATGMGILLLLNMLVASSEISMPDTVFRLNSTLGPPAVVLFAYALLVLLWYFPEPISRFPFGAAVLAFGLFVCAAQYFQFFEFPLHPYTSPFLLALIVGTVIGTVSWRRTRHKPLQRASVMWFVLSVVGVSGFVSIFYTLPVYFDFPPIINANVALFAFTFVFIGIALGTLKYRLFDIQRIWWKTITWMVGGLVVVLADILLISQFDFEQNAALPLALLIAGWGYFPVRQFLFEYFVRSRYTQIADHVPQLIDRFSGIDGKDEIDGRFIAFLRDVFRARDIGSVSREPIRKARLEDNGLALRVPDISGNGSIRLIGKKGGRELFSLNDIRVANSFARLVRYMGQASEREFEKLQADRAQIVRDLHDDVGGRLLSMIYNAPAAQFSSDARDTLNALKESLVVIEDTQTVSSTVAWQRMKDDACQRLQDVGFVVGIEENILTDRILSAREFMNLRRIMQEITSNIIKYGKHAEISLSFDVNAHGDIQLCASNEIGQLSDETYSTNRGLSNIKTRMAEIGGSVETAIENRMDRPFYRIEVSLPLGE